MSNKEMITYESLLKELETSDQESHLLLGNGFNLSLGISTDYKSIFQRMMKTEGLYGILEDTFRESQYDIENIIGKLILKIDDTNLVIGKFLKKFLEQKIKFDFMKAASEIVRENVNKIYKENIEAVYLLLKNFTNYFTLNYDTFLYLLLMKFKKNPDQEAVAFSNSTLFQKHDLDEKENGIYSEIEDLRNKGKLDISLNDEHAEISMKEQTKTQFENTINQFNKEMNKGWSTKSIKKVCGKIWEEKKRKKLIERVNDGFQGELFRESSQDLNFFFLHGSFHLYTSGNGVKKITKMQDKALYERMEEIIQSEEKDIICVLTNDSDEKKKQIESNRYLTKCYENLSQLSGNIVIFGSALSENDAHIFRPITLSQIKKVYISSCPEHYEKDLNKAQKLFHKKEIVLFDYNTVSYKATGNNGVSGVDG